MAQRPVKIVLESWQQRMVRDLLGVETEVLEVSIGGGPVVKYGVPTPDEPGLRREAETHPLARRFYADRTVTVPQWAYVCGTTYSAEAVTLLAAAFAALKRQGLDTPPFGAP